jgi:hypothetical protein
MLQFSFQTNFSTNAFKSQSTLLVLQNLITELYVSLEEKTKFMSTSLRPNSGQNQNIRKVNESFEKVAKFKYLGTTLTNQSDIRDEIKSRLNSENA